VRGRQSCTSACADAVEAPCAPACLASQTRIPARVFQSSNG
jgi:hypothetical protein